MIWEIDDETRPIEGVDAQGRPDPAYAAALGLVRAPYGRRALAALVDAVIWLVLQLPFLLGALPLLLKLTSGSISLYGFVNHPQFVLAVIMAGVSVLLSLILLVVQLVLHGRRGLTIGKAVAGIRSVNVLTLERPGVGRVLLRDLVLSAVAILPLGLPLFLILPVLDPDRRGRAWHDKAGRLWLVDVRKGLNPYDEKRMRVARKMVRAEPIAERAPLPSLATSADPVAQAGYRPGGRLSAGVIGAAKPYDGGVRPQVGLTDLPAAPVAPVVGEEGKPVLGGYRLRDAAEPAPPPAPADIPAAVPAAPAAPTAAQPAPPPPAPPAAPARPAPELPVEVLIGAAAVTPAAPARQPARFLLRFDDGQHVLVSQAIVLGRRPEPSGIAAGAQAVAIADETRSLSKTHAVVRPVDGGLEIVDCHSTNGTAVLRGGVEHPLAPGGSATAAAGDVVRIGDRTAAVERV
ncbi:FHA domain-containing protein [Microbacterium sp. MEC084]|uniref:RDD family protein n=1 Tax=Microbacterium sp. MEC084 TaxID=1963027 RepID=UPI0014302C16|nr:RDD family protein [Microbacterium sp. MEC084]MCD1267985.1 FHA domain-containing protein [Microbacterium sp. MEC084]